MNNTRGSALVEFAILLPILLILAFGITELGRALYQKNILGKSVESGVRYLARGYDAIDDDCSTGSTWAGAQASATNLVVYGNEAGTGNALLPGLDAGGVSFSVESRPIAGASDACVVMGSAAAEFDAIFGKSVIPFMEENLINLHAESEERYIGD
ncbi:pilus assembly protein [Marinobacter sediminum]|uniref:TadE/TadG family type IV pilus assembly protein n=1 Tax=Marinobacter sediminum TaxID=256323 RepID=UPI00202E2A59|nr:TadE/TadG family type IV pilus assembly protein [Marinobacter sediminum]MCM0612005.1 pilus assembly protein [Marinobacter sediminum]